MLHQEKILALQRPENSHSISKAVKACYETGHYVETLLIEKKDSYEKLYIAVVHFLHILLMK